ncbi:MAG: TSUP family transporter, partial [Microthrixaceae bacterium]
MIVPLLVLAVAAGAALQSATGFGFSLLSAPILFAVLEPQPAIGLLALLGIEVNLMTLLTEGRRPQPLVREAAILVGFALPGALVGVVVLRNLPALALQVLLSAGIVVTLVVRHALTSRAAVVPVHHDGPRPRPAWSAPLAGLLAGALSTSTSTSGPPLLLHLLGRGARPSVVRDTLTVCFMSLGLITPIALVVTRTTEAVPD